MGILNKTRFFPWTTLAVGLVGFALRCWLYSDIENGLIPANHPAGVICVILLALVLAAIWCGTRNVSSQAAYGDLFPRSVAGGVGILLAAVGFGISAFTARGIGLLRLIVPILGVISAAALALTGLARLQGRKPIWIFHCVVAVYLMLRTMAYCSGWSSQTQLQLYFFQLLACCFLMLAAYYRVSLDVRDGQPALYVFFAQAALFCCCLCCASDDWLFYLSAGLWMAADFCNLPLGGRYAQ